jgi:3-hydroxyacyl-CoA dehydrogenase/enoyl-CoA hydratase/3-hydroxybutyryl-CoA epimerase
MTHFSVTYHEQFAYVKFDMINEKVNTFNKETFKELNEILHQLESKSTVDWVLFDSSKSGVFIAGADILELSQVNHLDEARAIIEMGHATFNRLAKLKPKTVALIDGAALGGGLEFSLACDFIVVTDSPKVKLGLPEVNLGIIPGWGGTQRLPRRIGFVQGVDHIVSGKLIDGHKAIKIGLADAMVAAQFKHDNLMALIRQKKLKPKRFVPSFLEMVPGFNAVVVRKVRQMILQKTKGLYPAPLMAAHVIQKTYGMPLKKGLLVEIKAVMGLFDSPIPKNLMGLFFSQENIKKMPCLQQATDRKIQQVGIVGAGLMGGGIGWWFVNHGQHVRFKDVSWDMIRKSYRLIYKWVSKGVKHRKIKPFLRGLIMNRISSTLNYSGFGAMDMIIEAVPENIDLKHSVLSEIEAQVTDDVIMATNTSSLSIDVMAQVLKKPDRFLGVHFFSPVQKMPLVEVIPSKFTSPAVIADVCKHIINNKKFPIIVKNCPGFLINRILLPYVNEAIHLMIQGFKTTDIDRIAVKFGMPLGPLALADEVGLDIGYNVLTILNQGYGDRFKIPDQFVHVVEKEQLLGKKSGRGFYKYSSDAPVMNTDIYKTHSIVMKYRISDQDESEIIDRLILMMLNEAARCIDEGVVESAELLDLAMIMGTGFPPFRGGLLAYADHRGLSDIVHRLNHLSQAVDQRFKPSSYLVKLSKENQFFHRRN